jgi:hypothetical protein
MQNWVCHHMPSGADWATHNLGGDGGGMWNSACKGKVLHLHLLGRGTNRPHVALQNRELPHCRPAPLLCRTEHNTVTYQSLRAGRAAGNKRGSRSREMARSPISGDRDV